MLIISARITLDPNHVDQYIEGACQVVEPTRAEPGCIRYSMARDLTSPEVICIFEEWESKQDLLDHLNTPHIKEFLALSADLNILNMELMEYEISSSGPMQFDS